MEKYTVEKAEESVIKARSGSNISVRTICYIAVFIALAFVLERLFPIVNAPTIRITLAFIPMMMCGMLFGPVWCAVAFGISDILGWPIMGLAPIPLILLARIINGLIFGFILRRDDLRFWPHSIISACSAQVICGMGLTTLGLSLLFGSPYVPVLISRLPQFIILAVLQIAVFPVILKLRDALRKTGLSPG